MLFGPPHDEPAAEALGRGWGVAEIPGGRLREIVDPGAVAAPLEELRTRWT